MKKGSVVDSTHLRASGVKPFDFSDLPQLSLLTLVGMLVDKGVQQPTQIKAYDARTAVSKQDGGWRNE
eukprot:892420-Amphidinium_carterae.2